MDDKKSRKENALTKSLSLIVEKSPTKQPKGDEDAKKKGANQSYSFLAALRKVKKLSTENIQNIYKAYNMTSLPTSLFNYGLRLSQMYRVEETALVLEVIMAFKEYISSIEINEPDNPKIILPTRVDMFSKVTSEFVDITEGMNTSFKYFKKLVDCLPLKVNWPSARQWIVNMIEKFINDKIIDAEHLIVDYVDFV